MKNRIQTEDWLLLKPYDTVQPTDNYYVNISNKVKQALVRANFPVIRRLGKKGQNEFACFLASYFEDVISQAGIWKAFNRIHFRHYQKELPFYPATKQKDDYYKGEVNFQDVAFLAWYYVNLNLDRSFMSPYSESFMHIALKVMPIFEEEFEYAPENPNLKPCYAIDPDETDFYKVRRMVSTVLFETWLFHVDAHPILVRGEKEVVEKYMMQEKQNQINIHTLVRENTDRVAHTHRTRLMRMKGKEWLATIIGEQHPVSRGLLNMSPKINGYFLYKGQDKDNVFMEHIATEKEFTLTKKSFDLGYELKEIDTIMSIGIVRWQNEWWFSGTYYAMPFNANLILEEKNSIESRAALSFLDRDNPAMKEMLDKQLEAFLEYNDGHQIAFLPSSKMHAFYEGYIDFYNASLHMSDEEIEQVHKRSKEKGYFGDEQNNEVDFTQIADTGLVFFNPTRGAEMAFDVNHAFPLSNNPDYDVNKSEKDVRELLMSPAISAGLAKYCIDECADQLPFFATPHGAKILKDIDFLLRFWKQGYHAAPGVTTL